MAVMQTYEQIEDEVRALAMSLPPSDFGSTRAIQAVAQYVYEKITPNCRACGVEPALGKHSSKPEYCAECGPQQ